MRTATRETPKKDAEMNSGELNLSAIRTEKVPYMATSINVLEPARTVFFCSLSRPINPPTSADITKSFTISNTSDNGSHPALFLTIL